MEKKVRNLFRASKKDQEFIDDLLKNNESAPSLWDEKETKIIYACIYMGWLMAKGKYKESDYE